MKRKIALAMVLAMTATMAQPVLAADDKTTLDVIDLYKRQLRYCLRYYLRYCPSAYHQDYRYPLL